MKKTKEKEERTRISHYRLTSRNAENDVLTFDTTLQCRAIQRISFNVVLIKFSSLMNFSSTNEKNDDDADFALIDFINRKINQWTIARLVAYLINIVALTSHSLILSFIFAHFAHLRERVFTQHRLFVFKHNWQNVVASLLSLRIRSTVKWWLWDWLKFSTFMTSNLCSSREWMIKWSNDEKKRRKNVILCSKLLIHIFICDEFLHFFHDHWFTFSTYHFRATSFSYIVFDKQREFLSFFIQYQDKHTNSINWLTSMWVIYHSIARKFLC